jgi:predicted metal-dependent hydrolase
MSNKSTPLPHIVIIIPEGDTPTWACDLSSALGESYHVTMRNQREGTVQYVIDHRTALIWLDEAHPDWQRWVTTFQTSNATRRIPILLAVAQSDEHLIEKATLAGVARVVAYADMNKQAHTLTQTYARVMSDEEREQLACDCNKFLPEEALEAVALFNAGEYYAQHDAFEALWVATESPVRDLYRAILQVGVGYYQIERGNYRGALKMLQRSVQWLLVLPDVCQGIDVAQLREDSFRVRAELERLGEANFSEFDKTLIKGVVLVEG